MQSKVSITLFCSLFSSMVLLTNGIFNQTYAFDTKLTIELSPNGDKSNPVVLMLDGKIYDDGWWFDQIENKQLTATEDENFMLKVIKTNQSGTPQDILNLFMPEERENMKTLILDPNLFSGNQAFYKKIKYSAFMSKIYYGSYIIFSIQHTGDVIGNLINTYPIKKVDNGYYLSNTLQNDPVYLYILTKYNKSLKYKQR